MKRLVGFAFVILSMALPGYAQYTYGDSVSVSGNTVTVTFNFDAGWSSTPDSDCPDINEVYPYEIFSLYYQVDGGTPVNIPSSDIHQSSWATPCNGTSPDNVYWIQFSYTDNNPGNHNVQVTVGYNDESGKDPGTVQGSLLSYSIAGAMLIDGGNLDDSNAWNYCTSSDCNPIAPSYFLWPLAHVSSPSTDGSALETYQYGPANWGILYYYTHYFNSQELNSTNFKVQWQYNVDSSNYIQALEFDFPVIYNNLAFYFGTQCVQGANWQYWNPNGTSGDGTHGWHDFSPTIPCTQTAANTWHTLVWSGTRTAAQFTYATLQIDGQQFSINQTLNAPTNTTGIANNTITIQFQPDGNYVNPNPGYHEYVDSIQAWVW